MDVIVTLIIALSLSMDALAVAITCGMKTKNPGIKQSLMAGIYFGSFQFIMPILGWFVGNAIASYITQFDHWIAFLLLLYVGSKMIYEAYEGKKECPNMMSFRNMIFFSIATSIDALAIGLSFAFLDTPILMPAIIIGAVTFMLSFAGVYIGKNMGKFFEKKAPIIGGLILIGIGLKILIQHLFF